MDVCLDTYRCYNELVELIIKLPTTQPTHLDFHGYYRSFFKDLLDTDDIIVKFRVQKFAILVIHSKSGIYSCKTWTILIKNKIDR